MTEPRPVAARPVRLAQIAVALFTAIKICVAALMPPIGDEAYYWMWGQKLGWSYFDHPPLHAWLLRLMSLLFGWNMFSLRALTWLTLAGTLWIFWDWARRLKPEDPGAWFWPSAAIYLASPLFMLMGSIAFHDHLLIFLCLASAHLFLLFAEKWETSGRGFAWLYAAAAVLGLAVLTKYNGVLMGVGVAVFFAARQELRPLYRSPHLYLAALLSIAIQAPVIWWNATEGFASYSFHISGRWDHGYQFQPWNLVLFIVVAIAIVSPFLFPAIFGIFRRRLGIPFADRARTLAIVTFIVSTLTMAAISAVEQTFFYWNITGFLLFMPLVAGWMERRWVLALHILYGLVLTLVIVFNFTVIPLGNLLPRGNDWTSSSIFGWPQTAARVAALEAEHKVGFIATTRYTTAAQLGFALHDPEVTALSSRHDQYDYWFDATAHTGEDALVVSDPTLGLSDVVHDFDSLTPLETVPYIALGRTVYAPTIYLGTNFHSPATK